jgi:hypothetical protein
VRAYEYAIKRLKVVGATAIEPEDQAADFIDKLDQVRYATMKMALSNNSLQ